MTLGHSLCLSEPVSPFTQIQGCPSSPSLWPLPSSISEETLWGWGIPKLFKQSHAPGPLQSGSHRPSASSVYRMTLGWVGSWEVSNFSENISADASEKGETWALQRARSLECCHSVMPGPPLTRQAPSPKRRALITPHGALRPSLR